MDKEFKVLTNEEIANLSLEEREKYIKEREEYNIARAKYIKDVATGTLEKDGTLSYTDADQDLIRNAYMDAFNRPAMSATGRKRGRKSLNMTADEWREYYLNQPIVKIIDELVSLKTGSSMVITKSKYNQLIDYKKKYNALVGGIVKVHSNIDTNDLSLFDNENDDE